MPPTGGAERILGNNPVAIAAPCDNEYPLLLDMALSNVALGKILYAKSKGTSIPEGWGADKQGRMTTDPAAVLDGGFILPVGGPKGFGLAIMIELLTGVLAGGQFSKLIPSMYDLTCKQSISHLMLAINVSHFIEVDRFKLLASQLSGFVKGAIRAEGVEELYLPGEIEFRTEKKRRLEGVPMEEKILRELKNLAETLQIPTNALQALEAAASSPL